MKQISILLVFSLFFYCFKLNAQSRGNGNNNKVTICHHGNTIQVAQSAVAAHLAHGDQLGACTVNNFACGDLELLNSAIANDADNSVHAKIIEQNNAIAARMANMNTNTLTVSGPPYLIPVVVHVVSDPSNPLTNISDAQILSQIAALNREFNITNTTNISFCLAQILPDQTTNWMAVNGTGTPGITRVADANISDHNMFFEQGLLNSVAVGFDPNRYLNIWVVSNISGGAPGTLGYAPRPIIPTSLLDGIVMRFDVFGDNSTCTGCYNLLPGYNRGITLVHETGHYLGLYHPFQRGQFNVDPTCQNNISSDGDLVADTPPVWNSASSPAGPNFACSPISTCNTDANNTDPNNPFVTDVNDLVNDYMDYTLDACKNLFTTWQINRMQATILALRSILVSDENLIYTGTGPVCGTVSSALVSDFYVPTTQVCTGTTLTYTPVITNNTATSWSWSFPGGTPATANTAGPHTITYSSPGIYTSILTVTGPSGTATSSQTIYVADCSVNIPNQSTWYFGNHASLLFAPSVAPNAPWPPPSNEFSAEGCASIATNTGTPLLYSNGQEVHNAVTHVQYTGGTLNGSPNNPSGPNEASAAQGVVTFPDPANANQYYIFTVSDLGSTSNPLSYSIVNATTNTIVALNVNVPGAPLTTEHLAAIPDCSGQGFWVVVHGLSTGYFSSLLSYHVTASGVNPVPVVSPSYTAVPLNANAYGQIDVCRDGSRLLLTNGSGLCELHNFDRQTGQSAIVGNLPNAATSYGASFSPNGQLIYTVGQLPSTNGTKVIQWDVSNWSCSNSYFGLSLGVYGIYNGNNSLQLGPDNRIYITTSNDNKLSVINYPDVQGSGCGYNFACISMIQQAPKMGLPNMVDAQTNFTPEVRFCSITCNQFRFYSNGCGTTYAWDFGDFTTSNAVSPIHSYSTPGVYTVTLLIDGNPVTSATVNATGAPAIYGLEIGSPSPITLNRIDPATGAVVQPIAVLPAMGNVYNGSSTFDPNNGIYLFRAFDLPSFATAHYAVDVTTGNVNETFVPDPVTEYEFDPNTGRMFGLVVGQGPFRLVEVNPYNGAIMNTIQTWTNTMNVILASTAYNPNTQSYMFRAVDFTAGTSSHYVVNVNSGSFTQFAAPSDVEEYQYDPLTNVLYGLQIASPIQLVSMNPTTGGITGTIATYPAIFNFLNGSSTYDPVAKNYYFRGVSFAGMMHFVTNITTTATTPSAVAEPITEYEYWGCGPFCPTCRYAGPSENEETMQQQNALPTFQESIRNFPNPSNDQTGFAYTTMSNGPVSIQIYDMSGKLIAQPLYNYLQSAGDHQFFWDCGSLQEGIYICRMTTSAGTVHSTMIIAR